MCPSRDSEDSATPWFPLPVPAPGRTRYTELGIRPDAAPDEVRIATARRIRALKQAGATEQELAEANAQALTNAEQRTAHDADHPPCSLLRLEPTWSPVFDDSAAALDLLSRELRAWLVRETVPAAQRSAVRPATDLDRTDFTGDFRHADLLDGKRDD